MKKILLCILMISIYMNGIAKVTLPELNPTIPIPPSISEGNKNDDFKIPDIITSGEDIDGDELRYLEKTYTIMMESRVDVFIPLEIITDIDIESTIIGNQIKTIPFDIELNRKPEKENYYSIKYSENILDIDNDGQIDTYIYSPKYINEKIIEDNYIKIYGDKISKEGKHQKSIYITVEVGGEE